MWHDMGHTSNLNLSWDKRGIRTRRSHFSWLTERERRGEEDESQRLSPKIYGVSLVSFRRAKNESSSPRQRVRVGTWNEGFHRRSKREDFGKSKLSGLGGFRPVYPAPRGKRFFIPWFTFHFLAGKLRACLVNKS